MGRHKVLVTGSLPNAFQFFFPHTQFYTILNFRFFFFFFYDPVRVGLQYGNCSSALFGRMCAEASCAFERVLWFERREHSDLAARRRRVFGGSDWLRTGALVAASVLASVAASVVVLELGPAGGLSLCK